MPGELITGGRHVDSRGILDHFNNLDLTEVVRFYKITPSSTADVRAWQGHKDEQKWFYCLKGSFIVNLIPLSKIKSGNPSIVLAREFTCDPQGTCRIC